MNYIGITIGPIFKTIQEANTPIGLWYGSTFFSYFTRTLCSNLSQWDGVKIFSPYFDNNQLVDDGVGLYHDRILFACPSVTKDSLDSLIEDSIRQMALFFPKNWTYTEDAVEAFLLSYIKVDYVVMTEEEMEGKNIVFELNTVLDFLELMVNSQVLSNDNLFSHLFIGEMNNHNTYLKDSGLFRLVKDKGKHLTKSPESGKNLRTIEDLSKNYQGTLKKPLSYFAVVSSDGDKVGKLLKSMCESDKGELQIAQNQISNVQKFSRACLIYAKKASDLVHQFDGMTIYAGGDDLLFLAPVESVFKLCDDLNQLFIETLSKELGYTVDELEDKHVSLSFGVGIYYYKFPLYEAFSSASQLLYQAKYLGGNRTNLRLTKHSGQTVEVAFLNSELLTTDQLIRAKYGSDDILQSILYKLQELPVVFKLLFDQVVDDQLGKPYLYERFLNHFDNDGQKIFKDYIESILSMFYDTYLESDVCYKLKVGGKTMGEVSVEKLQQLLTLLKFWQGGDNE